MGICASVASSDTHETNEIFEEEEEEKAILIEANTFPNKGLASVYSEQGCKGLNQDTAILCQGFGLPEGSFCAVFDGHGKNGHMASKLVRNCLPKLLLDQRKALALTKPNRIQTEESLNVGLDKWRRACIDAFKVMDRELKLQNIDYSCSGTTAVTIIKQDQDLIIANLGDSRAILGTTSDNGELVAIELTTDLKPGLPEETERIRNNNGRVFALKEEAHIQRVWLPDEDFPGLAMSRAFGDFQLKNYGIIAIPEISYHRVDDNKDKFLVLATDGVWDVLSSDDVAKIVWASKREDMAAKAVADAAVAAWKCRFPSSKRDDCTVACLFLQEKQPLIT